MIKVCELWGMGNEESVERWGENGDVYVGIFDMHLFKSFPRTGDPAWDLPDPEEHAPFGLVCQLYLVWKDPQF